MAVDPNPAGKGGQAVRAVARSVLRFVGLMTACCLLLVIAALSFCPCVAGADDSSTPQAEDQFVYSLITWRGTDYGSGFVPQQIDEIYLVANTRNALTPLETSVYFWPITGQYMADWASQREPVSGVLEVIKGGKVIETVSLQDCTLRYPEGLAGSSVELLAGDEAVLAYQEYVDAVAAFDRAALAYQEAMREYEAQIAAMFRAMREEGKTYTREEIPVAPVEPSIPQFYVRSIQQSFMLELDPGRYTIRMVQDGSVIEGSEKTLVAFAPRRRGLTFTVRPEESWTVPLLSNEEAQTLYLGEEAPFYLQAYDAEEFNLHDYSRLVEPSKPAAGMGARGEYTWMAVSSQRDDLVLRVYEGNQLVAEIDQRPYYVAQTQSSSLGYTIIEWDPMRREMIGTQPTMRAFRLALPPGQYRLQSVTLSGEPVSGGSREIRQVNGIGHLWWISAIPLLVGLAVFVGRRLAFRMND